MFAIEAHTLTKHFPKTEKPSVSDLSFTINQGETVAFLGPNGAGKSTTIKMLCGILAPSSGSARILGLDAGTPKANQNLGLVFGTRSQLYMHMTVEHCLDLSAEIYFLTGPEKTKRIAELAEAFQIGPYLKRRVRTLSLGERMRCEVVAALVHKPRVLLADEPTIGLDVIAKNNLRKIIREWQSHEKTTLMLTSHDLSDVEALCERCILIDHGKKKYDGNLSGVKGALKNLRRIQITTQDADRALMLAPGAGAGFRIQKKESEYVHLYELLTTELPMSDAMFRLSNHYGDSLQDIQISEVTLEEVLGSLYGRR